MDESIATLSPEQAQRALMIFYDLLPGQLWEGGAKPSTVKIEAAAERLQEEAPDNLRPAVNALLTEGGEEEKGEAARVLLATFYEEESLRGYVEQATEQARQPHMAPIPLIVGAVIVLLAALPKKVDTKKGTYEWGQLRDAAVLVKAFGDFAAKLPKAFWDRLTGGGGD